MKNNVLAFMTCVSLTLGAVCIYGGTPAENNTASGDELSSSSGVEVIDDTQESTEISEEKQTDNQQTTEVQTEAASETASEAASETATQDSISEDVTFEDETNVSVDYIIRNYKISGNFNPSLTVKKSINLGTYFVDSVLYKWYMPENDCYTLSEDGVLSMTRRGRATIYAYSDTTGLYYTFYARPKSSGDDEKSNTISKSITVNIKKNQTKDLYSYVENDITATSYTWKSDDTDVVEVTKKGVITGESTGNAYVKCYYYDEEKSYNYSFRIYVDSASEYTNKARSSSKSTTVTKKTETDKNSKNETKTSNLTVVDGPQIIGEITPKEEKTVDYAQLALNKFADISHRSWAHNAIGAMVEKGYINGVSADSFLPDNECTRADFSIVLTKMLGLNGESDGYADVNTSDYFYSYVGAIKAANAEAGVADNLFRPRESVTREEAFTMVYKALVATGKEFDTSEAVLENYADSANISSQEYRTAIAALLNKSLISGTSQGIEPSATITRAQMAVLLNNVYSNM